MRPSSKKVYKWVWKIHHLAQTMFATHGSPMSTPIQKPNKKQNWMLPHQNMRNQWTRYWSLVHLHTNDTNDWCLTVIKMCTLACLQYNAPLQPTLWPPPSVLYVTRQTGAERGRPGSRKWGPLAARGRSGRSAAAQFIRFSALCQGSVVGSPTTVGWPPYYYSRMVSLLLQ